jgi:hypothetical protein
VLEGFGDGFHALLLRSDVNVGTPPSV